MNKIKKVIMIYIIKFINNENYDYLRCGICDAKIGWKLKDSKVKSIILPEKTENKLEPLLAISCKRCKTDNFITTEVR